MEALTKSRVSFLILLFVVIFIGTTVKASERVTLVFFYYDFGPICPTCLDPEIGRVRDILREIKWEYEDRISILPVNIRVDEEGRNQWKDYGFTRVPAILVRYGEYEYQIEGEEITREKLREVINAYLEGRAFMDSKMVYTDTYFVLAAFLLGLFSGFSPCLMAMLAFILTYTASSSINLRWGITRMLSFGSGLVIAIVTIGSFLMVISSVILDIFTLIAALIMLVAGFNLSGILKLPVDTRPFFRQLAKKHGSSLLGLFSLGVLFVLIKGGCLIPYILFLSKDTVSILSFSLGVLAPFFGVGVIGGGTPHLARRIREKHRLKLRVASGVILIAYGIWLLILLML